MEALGQARRPEYVIYSPTSSWVELFDPNTTTETKKAIAEAFRDDVKAWGVRGQQRQ